MSLQLNSHVVLLRRTRKTWSQCWYWIIGFPFPRWSSKWIAWINKQVWKKTDTHLLDDHGKHRWKGISRSHLYHPTLYRWM